MKSLRLFLLALPITTVFSALAVLATSVGALRPPHAALAEFAECNLPCWRGIVPGVTSRYEANNILMENGYRVRDDKFQPYIIMYRIAGGQHLCEITVYYRDELVDLLEIKSCGEVYLGDLMTILGTPDGIFFGRGRGSLSYLRDRIRISPLDWSTPFSHVVSVVLYRHDNNTPIWPWHGFLPHWRYCQLEMVCFR